MEESMSYTVVAQQSCQHVEKDLSVSKFLLHARLQYLQVQSVLIFLQKSVYSSDIRENKWQILGKTEHTVVNIVDKPFSVTDIQWWYCLHEATDKAMEVSETMPVFKTLIQEVKQPLCTASHPFEIRSRIFTQTSVVLQWPKREQTVGSGVEMGCYDYHRAQTHW